MGGAAVLRSVPLRDKSEQPTRLSARLPVVLVVEDDHAIRKILTRTLRSWGCVVRGAATGAEGVEQAKVLHPHVILTDLTLGDGGGVPLVASLREACPHAALVVVSGAERPDLSDEVEYVQKPFDPVALVQRVKRLLGRGGHSTPPSLPPPAPAEPAPRGERYVSPRVARTTSRERPFKD